MKILHIVDSLNRQTGGPSRSVGRLADELAALGEEVTVVANDYRELGEALVPRSARVELVPARRMPFRLGARSPGLPAVIERETGAADLVHVHGLWLPTNHRAARAARRHRKPYVVSPRGMLEPWAMRHRAFRKSLVWVLAERRFLRAAAALHATAEAEAESFRIAGLANPVVVAPNGIDIPDHFPGREVIETAFPAVRGRRILLFLSRLHPKKGVTELLSSWEKLQDRFPEWLLVLAGDDFDNHESRYRSQAQIRLGGRALFTGDLQGEEKSSMLAACELFVLPSHSENFGLVIGEALAAGKPVITTRATPWKELVSESCGWWIPPSEANLTPALAEALSRPAKELAQMGQRGAALVRERYSWPRAARVLRDHYHSIIDRP